MLDLWSKSKRISRLWVWNQLITNDQYISNEQVLVLNKMHKFVLDQFAIFIKELINFTYYNF